MMPILGDSTSTQAIASSRGGVAIGMTIAARNRLRAGRSVRSRSQLSAVAMTRARNVLPPANIVANVYAVNIAVKSDQSTSTTSQYQITINTSSIVPYIGGAIVLVIIGGLVFMYRKYGRR